MQNSIKKEYDGLKLDQIGIDFLIKHEGTIEYEYLCPADKKTIGIGMLTEYLPITIFQMMKLKKIEDIQLIPNIRPVIRTENDSPTQKCYTMDQNMIELTFLHIVSKYEYIVYEELKDKNITQNQFNALVSFCYNVGSKAFIKSKLLEKIKKTHPNLKKEKISNLFLQWTRAGNNHNVLLSRRLAEIDLFFLE
ncbi:MAG: glycoside hydrolase family protein [Chitinophagaceae bacterium]